MGLHLGLSQWVSRTLSPSPTLWHGAHYCLLAFTFSTGSRAMCQIRAFSPSPGCSNCVWPGAVTAVESHGTPHIGLQWNPWRGWGDGSRRHLPEVGPKRSGILLRSRMSQAMPSQSHHRLHLLAAAEEGCWISHFPHCCEKMPSKKQVKEEKDAVCS